MKKKEEYVLEGLGCANCAAKMEKEIQVLEGVREAFVNFSTGTFILEIEQATLAQGKKQQLLTDIQAILDRIEPGVVIREASNKYKKQKNMRQQQAPEKEQEQEQEQEQRDAQDKSEYKRKTAQLVWQGLGVFLYLAVLLFPFTAQINLTIYLISYFLIGGKVVGLAARNIIRGQIFDENFLMTIATAGAFTIGEYAEAVAVMLFYQIGEIFQDFAVQKSRRSIRALMNIRPDYANVKKGSVIERVSPEQVAPGEQIVIKPGERVPLDGTILQGASLVDTSALTGEAVPQEVQATDEILSGSINLTGLLVVEVSREYEESTVARILDLVQYAGSKKAPTEHFITKFARVYTPFVVGIAGVLAFLPPLFLPGAILSDWLYRALIFLVISCPCALVVSIPVSFFGGLGGASRKGILVKGGNYLEALNKVKTVVFDKTGTLTKGVFKVTAIYPAVGFKQEQVLQFAALAEVFATHPVAKAILEAFGREVPGDEAEFEFYEEIGGYGVKAVVRGKTILVGNNKLMEQENVNFETISTAGVNIYVAIDGQYAGQMVIADEIKEDSANTLQGLKKLGIQKIVMLTGDNQKVAAQVAQELQIEEYYAELLPQEKVMQIEKFAQNKEKGSLVFVGDGINDAPVLARADVGVAMGGLGADAALEAADVVIMTDEPSKLVTAIEVARRTQRIVWQNITMALVIKALVLVLGTMGVATMWEAVFADVGVALLAVFNALRAMRG